MKGSKMKDTKKKHRRKTFSVHDLYPADYCFDWKSFEADPEHYHFTEDDNAYINAMELDRYEASTPMTPAEKRALRRWVSSGHSVTDAPLQNIPVRTVNILRRISSMSTGLTGRSTEKLRG
jgi:hypothetical protein